MKNILIGIPVKNCENYIINLFEQINLLTYPKENISIAIVEGDSDDKSYDCIQQNISILKKYNYRNIFFEKKDYGFSLHPKDRHDTTKPEQLKKRIQNLVKIRNFIVDKYLLDNDFLWWVDADYDKIPNNSIEVFLNHNKDIIIPYLLHPIFGYHDCGSYGIVDGNRIRLFYLYKYIDNTTVYRLQQADCHCFINRRVFDGGVKYNYYETEYIDMCGGVLPAQYEGVAFSRDAIKNGFEVWGCSDVKILHHAI